jgi:uncharacterized protein (DUF2342 family)
MRKQYLVDLTANERARLVALTRKGNASARQVTRASVLLHAADGLKDAEIAAAAHTSVPTVARIRKRFGTRNRLRDPSLHEALPNHLGFPPYVEVDDCSWAW